MRSIYWFRNDLRLHDNPGLLAQRDADELLLVYVWPKYRPWCNITGIGAQRERFLIESLLALDASLRSKGQRLLLLHGAAETLLPHLVERFNADRLLTSLAPGFYERRAVAHLSENLSVPVECLAGNSLFAQSDLPGALAEQAKHFTPFREAVGQLRPQVPIAAPAQLPPPPTWSFTELPAAGTRAPIALPLRGGEQAGLERLNNWVFGQQGIADYAKTRNCLDGLDGSSTLSPWLATGCLSVREAAAAIARYEAEQGANESTEWLYQELLWREFFYWRAVQDDRSLFRSGGDKRRIRRCIFEPRNFARWCQGDTNQALVNALMRQLNTTGWMSNRGRQLAASFLINELDIDWRYGAAYFEKHLIDFDVASNYGNWQYIAGVGADPRGGRHFNIDKQARLYDPDGLFVSKWQGNRPQQPEFVTDAADWPIMPE